MTRVSSSHQWHFNQNRPNPIPYEEWEIILKPWFKFGYLEVLCRDVHKSVGLGPLHQSK